MQLIVRYAQPVAAFCPPAPQYFAAPGRGHALTKAVLVSSLAVGRLKCPFHDAIFGRAKVRLFAFSGMLS